jgi:hypothetical protein
MKIFEFRNYTIYITKKKIKDACNNEYKNLKQ